MSDSNPPQSLERQVSSRTVLIKETNLFARSNEASNPHPDPTHKPPQSRNKRIFGHLMKSLGSFQQASLSSQRSERETKRREVEARIEERQRIVDEKARRDSQASEARYVGRDRASDRRRSSRGARDLDWRRSRSPPPPKSFSDARYRDPPVSSTPAVVQITRRDRDSEPTAALLKKFETFKEQASFLKTRTEPSILYLPVVLTPDEKGRIVEQQKEADELLETCSKALQA